MDDSTLFIGVVTLMTTIIIIGIYLLSLGVSHQTDVTFRTVDIGSGETSDAYNTELYSIGSPNVDDGHWECDRWENRTVDLFEATGRVPVKCGTSANVTTDGLLIGQICVHAIWARDI
jgi:hypothetical protein